MKPAAFDYHRPHTLEEALDLLASLGGDGKVLAGGQSLIPIMNFRLATPEHLIDINDVDELRGCQQSDQHLVLGALTRHQEYERRDEIVGSCPLLARVTPYIGHPQIRTRGTLGGSLAHADPSAELPATMVALDATFVARSKSGERRVKADDFFTYLLTTDLQEDELLVAVEIPMASDRQGSEFLEVAARHGDFAMVGAAAVLKLGETGEVTEARIVCSAVAPTPVRILEAEEVLRGRRVDEEVLFEVSAIVARSLEPTAQLRASTDYKRRTAGVLARRAVESAWHMAQGSQA